MRLGGKTFLVTGASGGIASVLTRLAIDRGATVVAADRDIDRMKTLIADLDLSGDRCIPVKLDVTREADWQAAIELMRERELHPDFLCNVAGVLEVGSWWEMTPDAIRRTLDVNTVGVALGCRIVGEMMKDRRQGHIINIASLAGTTPTPGISIYGASKYAARALSLSLATELKRDGIAVSVVCPDGVVTPMLVKQLGHESAALPFSGSTVLQPEDVALSILDHVIPYKPLEIFLPRWRGWLCRLGDLFPTLGLLLDPIFRRKGMAGQQRVQAQLARSQPTMSSKDDAPRA